MWLPLNTEGQLELPKQPPFEPLTPGWAVKVTVHFGEGDPNIVRLFDAWYHNEWRLDARAGDGRSMWVRAAMQCVVIDHQRGLQVTRAWTEPLRRASGQLYRPTPRWQKITRPAYTYMLASQRWAPVAMPEIFKRRSLVLEAVN